MKWFSKWLAVGDDHVIELEAAVAFALGRLEPDQACPRKDDLASSLRMLANERAAWIEVAVEHNKQCPSFR